MGFFGWLSSTFGGGSSSTSSSKTSSSSSSSSSSGTTARGSSAVNSKYTSSSSSSSKASSYSGNYNYNHNSPSYTQTQTGNKWTGGSSSSSSSSGTTARSNSAVNSKYTSSPSTTSTGTGGNTGSTTQTTNIPANPVQSNIAGTSANRTWEMTYTNAATVNDPSRTTETWQSSDGMQVAFAGISASALSDYYAEKGDLVNAGKFAEITAASGGGTSYGSTNWRNSSAGQAISLGTATTEQKLDAMKSGASASNVGLFGTTSTFETTPYYQSTHPDEPTVKTLTTYDGGYTVTAAGASAIPVDTGSSGNIPVTTSTTPTPDNSGGGNIAGAGTGTQDIVVNITVPETETPATGSGANSGIMDMLMAMFLANLGTIGDHDPPTHPADGTSDYADSNGEAETASWQQYIVPAVVIGGVAIGAAVLLTRDTGGKAHA